LLRLSVVVALLTIVLKTLAWWLTGSVGLLSDALESFVNLAGAMFALTMVTVAKRPADDEHPYGHYKAEYFSAGFEGMLVIGASLAIVGGAVAAVEPAAAGVELGPDAVAAQHRLQRPAGLGHVALGAQHRSMALEGDAGIC
jgi:cation diffusion facilitator family transporter